MAVTASMVKELREKTGVGMMDCKKALAETGGDMEAAVDWLRKKGMASAQKKSARVAAEGKVTTLSLGSVGVMLEVNAETDFTAKNDNFCTFADTATKLAADNGCTDIDTLKALDYPGTGRNVGDELTNLIATIGENMNLRRIERMEVSSGLVSSYIHAGGKIGVLVALESTASADALQELGKKLAMHVAAAAPQFLNRDSVDSEAMEREKSVLIDQARASGKPDNIIEKMIVGRMDKYYADVCLLEQAYVIDPDHKVQQVVDAAAKELGCPVKVTGYARFQLGEGIEKKEEDFAAEVAKVVQG
ncbi:translation elongation factor Ts (EF-Ts) [Magnetococcus marinus MC-1]|uniref:Elongation factor Ts n=1 Tax=Magnetococcus marinus (strain ATCC BAA-1437 / JCM 17883 / MC-1) TaxID=156889 RepID=EFTS_MAGMM|nr:translation elongation factor Ts [Magnetococcus marinus]A0L8Q6.1 RecName: Full=Elongation factor Ts; Short=EF-Ts [Magnetococcus marinus MC-1]ABK44349.1 translation elongation factor Ts (EF-Ts) [Magnetococcus marinus MC-1]